MNCSIECPMGSQHSPDSSTQGLCSTAIVVDVLLHLTLLLVWPCGVLQDFAKRAAAACGKDVSELSKSFTGLQAAHAPYFCLDLSFCHTVLTQGFDLPETASITLVKQVGGVLGA